MCIKKRFRSVPFWVLSGKSASDSIPNYSTRSRCVGVRSRSYAQGNTLRIKKRKRVRTRSSMARESWSGGPGGPWTSWTAERKILFTTVCMQPMMRIELFSISRWFWVYKYYRIISIYIVNPFTTRLKLNIRKPFLILKLEAQNRASSRSACSLETGQATLKRVTQGLQQEVQW